MLIKKLPCFGFIVVKNGIQQGPVYGSMSDATGHGILPEFGERIQIIQLNHGINWSNYLSELKDEGIVFEENSEVQA